MSLFPYPLMPVDPAEPSEDAAVLIRELAEHVWGRLRAAVERVVAGMTAPPPSDRQSLTRMPF